MTPCPGMEQLERLLAEQLADVECGAVEAHVEGCAACQQALAELAGCVASPQGERSRPPLGTGLLRRLGEALPGSPTDTALRQRLEALLLSPEQAGSFPDKPVPERLAEELPTPKGAEQMQAKPPTGPSGDAGLDFLDLSDKPGSLGRLGHYDVLEVIGRGGMGAVLRAFDDKLHRVVAIKVLAAHLATNGTARKRFVREAQAAAAVRHEHVIDIHAVEEANGLPYLAMEYIAGVSLQERLERDGPLELKEVLRIGMQTAAGLAAAHAQGLIHRDIKPANIMLENGVERVKITDFGLARAVDDGSLTESGVVAGTPQYMSPEQAQGVALDYRTDLFSLGSVLYILCTGRAPFRASGTMAVLKRVCEETPRPIRESNPEVPDWLVEIIAKLHAKDPADRFQSAAEVAALLGHHLAQLQQPVLLPATSPPEKPAVPERAIAPRRRRWAIAGALLFLLVCGLGLGVAALLGSCPRDGSPVVQGPEQPPGPITPAGDAADADRAAAEWVLELGGQVEIVGGVWIAQRSGLPQGPFRLRGINLTGSEQVTDAGLNHLQGLTGLQQLNLNQTKVSEAGARRLKEVLPKCTISTRSDPPFVILVRGDNAEQKLATLAEAVAAAGDGDTIEIRGDGPFDTDPIDLQSKPLILRAGAGWRPVLRLTLAGQKAFGPLLATRARLVLEGLEFHQAGWPNAIRKDLGLLLIDSLNAPLSVAGCRFQVQDVDPNRGQWVNPIRSQGAPICEVRNCLFLGPHYGAISCWISRKGGHVVVENCAINAEGGLTVSFPPEWPDLRLAFRRNTLLISSAFSPLFFQQHDPSAYPREPAQLAHVHLSENVFVFEGASFLSHIHIMNQESKFEAQEGRAMLRRLYAWQEQRNLYPGGKYFLQEKAFAGLSSSLYFTGLADWNQFWGMADNGSVQGRALYAGGDLKEKAKTSPWELAPGDFRLHPDSAGKGAGEGGRDLGADVDQVGPGPAYERWKKTPAYQQWLKDTGQVK